MPANEQPEEQAQVIALRYERFVKGSMNFFNHQSNVDFNTRIVDFNLKDLPDSMLVLRPHQCLRSRPQPHVLQCKAKRPHMALRRGDAEYVRVPDGT